VIFGSVNSQLEAVVQVMIRGPQGEVEIDAIVDTGFNGALTLSPDVIATLGLRLKSRGRGVLADESESSFDVYEALILWSSRVLLIAVGSADAAPLLGMSLLYGHDLTIQVIESGAVAIHEILRS
jgi:clan AA aspartic protease